jgi:hypothetical protein
MVVARLLPAPLGLRSIGEHTSFLLRVGSSVRVLYYVKVHIKCYPRTSNETSSCSVPIRLDSCVVLVLLEFKCPLVKNSRNKIHKEKSYNSTCGRHPAHRRSIPEWIDAGFSPRDFFFCCPILSTFRFSIADMI